LRNDKKLGHVDYAGKEARLDRVKMMSAEFRLRKRAWLMEMVNEHN
jgi:hypothetical protein